MSGPKNEPTIPNKLSNLSAPATTCSLVNPGAIVPTYFRLLTPLIVLHFLLGMTGSFLGAEVGAQITSCAADYKADIVRQLLPRCDDKCQPMKQCESSCKALKSKCVPSSLQGYFPMVKKGGSLRSMLPMIGLSESAPEMKVIDAWLEKLNKCKSEQLTSATVCLSKNYKGKMCNPGLHFFKERMVPKRI